MPRNPAITTYEAWDSIFRFMHYISKHAYFREVEHPWELDSPDPDPPQGYYRGFTNQPVQMLSTTHGFRPVAIHAPTGRYIYQLIHNRNNERLLRLAPDGSFQLGDEFEYNMTWRWGPFDAVTSATKFLDHSYGIKSGKVWYIRDPDEGPYRSWRGVRDWERPVMYWRSGMIRRPWLFTEHVDGFWRASVVPDQLSHENHAANLEREYTLARERYERYRQRYLRDNNLPDQQRPLDASDIETVDHISQHVNLYEPGKARLLRDVTPAC